MTRGGNKATVTRDEGSTKFLSKHDISSVVSRKIVPQLPNSRQQNATRILCQPTVHEVADRLISAPSRDDSLLRETPTAPV